MPRTTCCLQSQVDPIRPLSPVYPDTGVSSIFHPPMLVETSRSSKVRYSQNMSHALHVTARVLGDQASHKPTQSQQGLLRFLPRIILPHMSPKLVYLAGLTQEPQRLEATAMLYQAQKPGIACLVCKMAEGSVLWQLASLLAVSKISTENEVDWSSSRR